jgi:hypothetical protein
LELSSTFLNFQLLQSFYLKENEELQEERRVSSKGFD